jgi:hypothetical protein
VYAYMHYHDQCHMDPCTHKIKEYDHLELMVISLHLFYISVIKCNTSLGEKSTKGKLWFLLFFFSRSPNLHKLQ